jgi:tetratricopeptide (TPR) repeat protein
MFVPARLLPAAIASVLALGLASFAAGQDYANAPERPARLPLKPADLQPADLRFWNDDRFRREFMASYIPATDIEPPVSEDDRDAVQDILKLIADEKFDEAIARIERRRNDASSAVYEFILGNIHFQNDRFDEAATAYLEATRKYPNYRRAWKNLGRIRVRQQDFASALPALTKVIELGGVDGTSFGLLGYCHAQVQDPIAAESAYRMAVLMDPASPEWKEGLALSLFRQERYPDAAAMLGKLIERSPSSPRLWILQANAFIGLNQPLRAAENYEMVDTLGGSTVETLNQLAGIYVNTGLYAAAVDTYDRAMEMDLDGRPQAPLQGADLMVRRGAHTETERLLDAIEALYGYTLEEADRLNMLRLRARIAVARGEGAEQVAILEEIIAVDPLDGDALLLLANHFYREGEFERAVFLFERAQSLEAFEADARVGHAQVLVRQQRYAEAIPLLKQAQSIRPRESVREFLEQVERFATRG